MSWEGHPGRVPHHLYRQLSTVAVPLQEKMPKLMDDLSRILSSALDTPEKKALDLGNKTFEVTLSVAWLQR